MFTLGGVYVEITSKCNLRCLHCYNESGSKDNILSLNEIENLVYSIKKSENHGFAISGGEPFMHPQIFEIIELLNKNDIKPNVISNATLINEKICEKLKKYKCSFQISLNGSCAKVHESICGTGTFNKTIAGIKNLISMGTSDISINIVLNKNNANDVVDIIKIITELGITNIEISSINMLGRAEDNKEEIALDIMEIDELVNTWSRNEYIQKMKKKDIKIRFPQYSNGCPLLSDDSTEAIKINPRIDSLGNVHICQSFESNAHIIGNIRENVLYDIIYNNIRLANVIKELKDDRDNMKECKLCIWQKMCPRGCPAISLMRGSTKTTDGYCSLRKKQFLMGIKSCI
ncbi:radical SAM/SPASM domain-containing protein [Clostridium formicaceticum]|uniref:Antilisterial bacteriocin subtilosin biosynthesis protein AlbA n=1 Tax=Clostridium formicaceticum TaxID=1497 RepID=A0AAC9RMK0_9CLOT|nr:radical SAM protein [Clostridium formicaceticum]AOY75344.1 hypothetical protein BJL90_05160 [Clostridium formicaceticum]ARE89794.1 Antilisterial bacteriocin subtilosin biosynthesis protein AlbA [Clostridium formicaceticum]